MRGVSKDGPNLMVRDAQQRCAPHHEAGVYTTTVSRFAARVMPV